MTGLMVARTAPTGYMLAALDLQMHGMMNFLRRKDFIVMSIIG